MDRVRPLGTTSRCLLPRCAKKNSRDPEPSALILDSQSVKADAWAEDTGDDAGKKIKGVKRHVVVDVLGLLIGILVHAANLQDRDGAKILVLRVNDRLPRVKLVWADGGYRGELVQWFQNEVGWTLEMVKRDADLSRSRCCPSGGSWSARSDG